MHALAHLDNKKENHGCNSFISNHHSRRAPYKRERNNPRHRRINDMEPAHLSFSLDNLPYWGDMVIGASDIPVILCIMGGLHHLFSYLGYTMGELALNYMSIFN